MIGTKSSAVTLVTLLFMTPMSGCLGGEAKESPFDSDHWLPDVEDRSMSVYRNDDVFSRVSWSGSYGIDEVRSVFVPVPEIEASDGGAGLTGGAEVHLGLWLPLVDGCDWDSSEPVSYTHLTLPTTPYV